MYDNYKQMQVEDVKKEIEQACLFGRTKSLKIILDGIYNFLNSKYYDTKYLSTAYLVNNNNIISILLKVGANPDTSYINDNPLLYDACFNGKEEIVNIFLNAGANPNIKNESGATPLLIAAYKGHHNIAKSLIKHGADIDSLTYDNVSIILMAARQWHPNTVKLLLQYGANLNTQYAEKLIPELCHKESKSFLELAIICQNKNFNTMSFNSIKHLPNFLKWKASIKPYDVEFKTKPLKFHLVEIYNLNKYCKTLEMVNNEFEKIYYWVYKTRQLLLFFLI